MATRKNERAMAGPAPGRPVVSAWLPCSRTSISGAFSSEGYFTTSPAAAVPVKTKIPVPIIAPIPRAVRLSAPRDRFSRRSGASATEINCSMFLTRKSCEPTGTVRAKACKLYLDPRRRATDDLPATADLSWRLRVWKAGARQGWTKISGTLEVRVTLHELFRAVVEEADGQLAVVAVAFDRDHRADARSE